MELLTDSTVGAVVSMTSALLPARESLLAGPARAVLLPPRLGWAPLRASEVVAV